jgi:Cdc6-like AAA superfamily ATPase
MTAMDLQTRMQRRQRDADTALVFDYEAISPVAHVADPVGRGPVLESLLDYLDPVLDGRLPPDAYIWGPPGAGKSAVGAALFAQLQPRVAQLDSIVHTATRTHPDSERAQSFVYVDARSATTDFTLYHAILDGVVEESVPTQGVRTETILDQLEGALAAAQQVVVAVDHVGEPETLSLSTLSAKLDTLSSLSWVAIGRDHPTDLDSKPPGERIEIPAYSQETLVDIVTSRAMAGLDARAVTHEQCRDIAAWAEGDAHDALAALFVAADRATQRQRATLDDAYIDHAIDAVPRPCVSLAQVLLLPTSRQRVLRALLDVADADRSSVGRTAAAIAGREAIDLSPGTVERYLYELADDGIVERVRLEGATTGRPPSRIEPRFPTRVFRRLHDMHGPQ